MAIRATLDGVEREIHEIEPILKEIDALAEEIQILMPTGINYETALSRVGELDALRRQLADRLTAVNLWQDKQNRAFVAEMRQFASDWKKDRP